MENVIWPLPTSESLLILQLPTYTVLQSWSMMAFFLYSNHGKFTLPQDFYTCWSMWLELHLCSHANLSLNWRTSPSSSQKQQITLYPIPLGFISFFTVNIWKSSVHIYKLSTRRKIPWEQGSCLSCSLLGPQYLGKWLLQGTHTICSLH